jgi:hypothetical protein
MRKKLLIMLVLIGLSLLWIRFGPEGYSYWNTLGKLVVWAATISVIVVIYSIDEYHFIELWKSIREKLLHR